MPDFLLALAKQDKVQGEDTMLGKPNKPSKRVLEIVHEGINFDLCRRVTLNEMSDGFCKVKMETFILPKRKKSEY